ncbi:MAG TPA: hypothetical protein DCL61_05485 [Cyanobacteria bacterium UBA12227]|nr:hypothetical protein [Cyanobacteria bacterium UBA12227]HAX88251.1 hypothetical protein [Cyanobacteria bacterium UBA11370]HBY77981.1 hypothetical protein [Cyanobacteria bacterium UBA11148]
MQALSVIDAIARELEQHENATRIKKLIVYASQERWENDITILERYQLRDLIQEIINSKPTLEQLSSDLDELVKTLNRQTEYYAIANIIINQLGKLYNEPTELTQVVVFRTETPSVTSEANSNFDKIARELEQDTNSLRIKKLIYYVCKGTWENDSKSLAKLNMPSLIQELTEAYSTLNQLASAITSQVQTLNRQTEYSIVASTIISKLESLYSDSSESTLVKARKNVKANDPVESARQQSNPKQSMVELEQKKRTYDAFDLRLEVMKYTNPLRAKLLLFSVVYHPFKATRQDWYLIRAQTLDDLLFQAFDSYKTIEELESKLYSMAKCLDASDENTQAASAIAQCMSRFYGKAR